jgi:hypothetical protein
MTVLFAGLDRIVAVAQFPASVRSEPQASQVGGGGFITSDQFVALARCESGTDLVADPESRGGYRTGLFGIEAGYDIGYLSRAEQEAWVQRIFDAHGARAWGIGCRGILGG